MTTDFDKEIDAILRKARGSETASVNLSTHLDADEISAFAENALPENAKIRSTIHLADCDKCRKILSNLILLGVETESEIVHAGKNLIAAPAAFPWYRKLFVFPNLAYSLGALVLVFGGLIALTVLQSVNSSRNAEISQVSNKIFEPKSASAAANTNATTNMANTAANTAPPANSEPIYSSNSAAPHSPANANLNTFAEKPPVLADEAQKEERNRDADDLYMTKTEATPAAADEIRNEVAQEKDKLAERSLKNEDNKSPVAKQQPKDMPSSAALGATKSDSPKKKSSESAPANGETTSVGGKSFRRANNVWYDTAYTNQPTTNITRGSGEYKKLDSGLRSIVQNLGGTVVIVWKSKAYRIQ